MTRKERKVNCAKREKLKDKNEKKEEGGGKQRREKKSESGRNGMIWQEIREHVN